MHCKTFYNHQKINHMKKVLLFIYLLFNYIITFSQQIGQISFSKNPLNKGQIGNEKKFKSGDAIYATALFPKTLKDYFINRPPAKKFELTVFIYERKAPLYAYQEPSEEQLTFATMWLSGDAMNQKYVTFELAPTPEKCNDYANTDYFFQEFGKKFDGPVNYTENLGKLSAGNHDLRIMVRINDEEVSTGELSITGDDFSMYAKQSETLNQLAKKASAKNTQMPKAMKIDKVLENQMIAALKNSNDWKSQRINAPELLKLQIIDSDWYIRRNELTGVILHRYIRAAVAVKTKNGECGFYPIVSFQEDYIGGKFQPLHYDGIGDFVLMDCANLNAATDK